MYLHYIITMLCNFLTRTVHNITFFIDNYPLMIEIDG